MARATKEAVEQFLKTYIESYMEAAKARKAEELPPLCKGYPYKLNAYIMPNEAVVCLFKFHAPSLKIDVVQERYDGVKAVLQGKVHDAMLAYTPMKDYSKEEAKRDAPADLARDLRTAGHRTGLDNARTQIAETEEQIKQIAKTNPWLERQLLSVADRLAKTTEPLDKLREEFSRMETEEKFADNEQQLIALQKYKKGEPGTPVAEITEEVIEKYILAYIDAYRSTIKPDYPEAARPIFYRGFPYGVRAFILPNEATAITFKYAAPALKVEVSRATPDLVADLLKGKEHSCFQGFPPLKSYRKEDAVYDAKLAVKRDMRTALLRALLEAARSQAGEEEKSILEISKTNPWLEAQLQQLGARLAGVKQLLVKLSEELEANESGKRYSEHEQLLASLQRHRNPVTEESELEVLSMEAPAMVDAGQPAWTAPGTPTRPEEAYEAPLLPAEEPAPAAVVVKKVRVLAAQGEPAAEAPPVRYELAAEEKQTLDMIKATLYNIDIKLDDFERRLNYMDKFVESIQKQQQDKFNTQNEILRLEARRAKYAGAGISTAALVLMMLFLLDWWLRILDPLRSLFGM